MGFLFTLQIMQSLPLAFESILFLKGILFWGVGVS
jgi:hypothetical protein